LRSQFASYYLNSYIVLYDVVEAMQYVTMNSDQLVQDWPNALRLLFWELADFGLSKSLAQNEKAANSRKNVENPGGREVEDDGLEGHEIER